MSPLIGWGLLLFVVLFWRLGSASFWDPDEAHYAQTTRELIDSGDFVAPYYNDQPFFDKPVLFHLLQSIPMRYFGPTEGAARLVPALAALAIIGTTWWLGATLAAADVGLTAALLMTVNPALFALSRYAILDTVFTAFLFGGVALLAVAALRGRRRLEYPGYLLIALATLTKGPIALVLTGLTFLIAIAVSADARRRLLGLRWFRGLILIIVVSAPWFLAMLRRFDGAFVQGYVMNENLRLFAEPLYQGQPPWWFYLQLVVVGMLPWTALVAGRLYDDLRTRRTTEAPDTFEVLLWSWVLAVVLFFSFSSFKLDHYVFPATPALCLIAARAWSATRASKSGNTTRGALIGARFIGPTLIVAGSIVAFLMIARLSLPGIALAMPVALVTAGVVVTVRSLKPAPAGRPRAPWIAVAAFGVLYAGVLLWVVPAFEQHKVVPDVARWVAANAAPEDLVADYGLNRWSNAFRFYVGRHTEMLYTPEEATRLFAGQERIYLTTTDESYRELLSRGLPLRVVYERDGMWVTSGRALWREPEATTRFLVVTQSD
jgi:4-amino-4-deoxy-L-arabinose transferase-like glycosyltransferase